MTRILVADDHAVVRRGVIQILEEAPEAFAIDEAANGNEVLKAVRSTAFDLLLLDIALPDINGLEILNRVRDAHPQMAVLMLSMYPEKQYAARALKAGAAGYLTKDSAPDELLTAVRRVLRGHKYVTLSVAEALLEDVAGGQAGEPHRVLSEREYQVMLLLARGKTVGEIAAELNLSVKTISTYRARLLEKLDLDSTADVIRYALNHGLVE